MNTKQYKAQYRATMKRFLRRAGVKFGDANNVPTEALETLVKDNAVKHSRELIETVEDFHKGGAKDWEIGNNSGNSTLLNKGNAACDRKRYGADKMLALLGISTSYPGLYPTFTKNDHQHHTLSGLVRFEGLVA